LAEAIKFSRPDGLGICVMFVMMERMDWEQRLEKSWKWCFTCENCSVGRRMLSEAIDGKWH
jgi:hypothetical protein